jgi:ribosomal-protein-alanine N-acetyltransferase
VSAASDLSGYHLRRMTRQDLAQIVKIEARAYDYPWSKDIFKDCLRVGYSCWVFDAAGTVQAYAIMSLVAGECHIMNLSVDPAVQGQGIGRAVLRQLIEVARHCSVDTMLLEVRPSNANALRLYRSEGFNEIGTRRAYYPAPHGREDAVILAKAL